MESIVLYNNKTSVCTEVKRSTAIHGFPVAATNYSSIGQTLSFQLLSTSSLFTPVKDGAY